uniref:Solute carrier family 23 member 1 n=1 Tax=Neogobius melanostomus TaxID=47308 RepID=A0A8C6WRB5_9GOBI
MSSNIRHNNNSGTNDTNLVHGDFKAVTVCTCLHLCEGCMWSACCLQMDELVSDEATGKHRPRSEAEERDRNKPTYYVTDVPPWYLCIFLAFQHYLTAFGAIISIPLLLSERLCLQHDSLTQGRLINCIFFVSGLVTVLQVTLGAAYSPGCTFSLVTPAMALLSLPEFECPAWTQNASLVNTSSPDFIEVWQSRLRTLQGSIMVASVLQIVVGFSGLIGFLMRFIGPLTTVSLIGLSLYDSAGDKAGSHWGISAMTTVLIVLFSQYLCRVPLLVPSYNKVQKLHVSKIYIFQIMPILLGITVSWLVCYLLTIYNVLPSDPDRYGYMARTDVKGDVIGRAAWLSFPYPGKGFLTGHSPGGGVWHDGWDRVLNGRVCGDYHACARLSGAPPPPKHAINRGIGIEGLGSLLAGAFGTGNGTTSFSENIAALGITKVGSRTVILLSGFVMIALGILGKIGAIFSTIPNPVIGGMFLVMFGVIGAAGIANLQTTDMNSSRNIFIFGFSMFSALTIPNWILKNPHALQTGVKELDQVLQILLTTHMFIGGFLGCVLDNTISGTKRERGLLCVEQENTEEASKSSQVYDLPFGISSRLSSRSWVRYIPSAHGT